MKVDIHFINKKGGFYVTLKEYLLKQPYSHIALLWFDDKQKLQCEEYGLNDYDKISDKLLEMEFMECSNENNYDECKEIWIR